MNFETWINAFLALFAILNPIGNIPIFAEFTDDLDSATRRKLFNIATATGFITLTLLTLTGKWVMSVVFQIDMSEFRIAGGLLLTILAMKYIIFPSRERVRERGASVLQLGVVPMAVPLLVGPGSIVTSILILDRDGPIIAFSALVAVFFVVWLLLLVSPTINRFLGQVGKLVVSRILWIFIAAIGVHFLVSGITEAFHLVP